MQHQDEVNQIALTYHQPQPQRKHKNNKKKSNKPLPPPPTLYLAAADDAGTVRFAHGLTEETLPTQSHTIHHDPNGVAVVTSCCFRPNVKGLELASGGTDCRIHLWDLTKPRCVL